MKVFIVGLAMVLNFPSAFADSCLSRADKIPGILDIANGAKQLCDGATEEGPIACFLSTPPESKRPGLNIKHAIQLCAGARLATFEAPINCYYQIPLEYFDSEAAHICNQATDLEPVKCVKKFDRFRAVMARVSLNEPQISNICSHSTNAQNTYNEFMRLWSDSNGNVAKAISDVSVYNQTKHNTTR